MIDRETNHRLIELTDAAFEQWILDGLLTREELNELNRKVFMTSDRACIATDLFRGWIEAGKFRNLNEAIDFAMLLSRNSSSFFAILASEECKNLISSNAVNLDGMMMFMQTVSSVDSLENIGWHIGLVAGSFEKRGEIEDQYFSNWTTRLGKFLLRNPEVVELLRVNSPDSYDQIKGIALRTLEKYRDATIQFTLETQKYFKDLDSTIDSAEENSGKSSINELQQRVIEGILSFPFSSIDELSAEQALEVLNCLLTREITPEALLSMVSLNIESEVKFIHDVLMHPYPQNRTTSYPYFGEPHDTSMIVYKDDEGHPAFEKKGLLSLTAQNDTNTAITKKAVCDHISFLVGKEIQKRSSHTSASAYSFWSADTELETFNDIINHLNKFYIKHKELSPELLSKVKAFSNLGRLLFNATINIENCEIIQHLLNHFSKIGDVESVNALLSHREVDVNFVRYFGTVDQITALSEAAYNGHPAVVKLLLSRAAQTNTQNTGLSPFLWAVRKGHVEVIKVFFEERIPHEVVPIEDVQKLKNMMGMLRADISGICDASRKAEQRNNYEKIVNLLAERGISWDPHHPVSTVVMP